MTATMFAMAVFASADNFCLFTLFYLLASGGLGASVGIVWTILPVTNDLDRALVRDIDVTY